MLAMLVAETPVSAATAGREDREGAEPRFQTSDRCIACHNGLTTATGEDVSIGFDWRASIMANSSRDPYWQASVRREIMDHPESQAHIEDECSICHMPITRYKAKVRGQKGEIFSHLPFDEDKRPGREAADGVDCSVCHQISREKLGMRESFNGGFVVDAPGARKVRPEYGPYDVDPGHKRIMNTSTGGFAPTEETEFIRKSEICATCHTLITTAIGGGGQPVGELAEQVPYPEWLHSEYKTKQTCQSCHMPEVKEPVPITRVLGVPREGLSRHTFVAANFFMQRMLNNFRDELEVAALPQELSAAAEGTIAYLQVRAARIEVADMRLDSGQVQFDVTVDNLGGHKLPTAYPSRRAWLHVTVRDGRDRLLFESGALRRDGSIVGNDNDADPGRFEPHYTEIDSSEQVQVYEDIIGDAQGRVTTGLLSGIGYLKDNRLLPHGFDKSSAEKEIAVVGGAAEDAGFTGAGHRIRYRVALSKGQPPFRADVELWYQPIGYRWGTNLKSYGERAREPQRFARYFDSMGPGTGVIIARASATK
jgi:hypothetical protein